MGYYEGQPITPQRSKDASITPYAWNPHYTDNRFMGDGPTTRSIYLESGRTTTIGEFTRADHVEGLNYMYDDRLSQHVGYDAVSQAYSSVKEAMPEVKDRSARLIEEMLKIALKDDDLTLGHILVGVNRGNGYSYKIFGVDDKR